MSYKLFLSLTVSGDKLEPTEITAKLGLKPTSQSRKGHASSEIRPPAATSRWSYRPLLSSAEASVEDQWQAMRANVEHLAPKLSELAEDFEVTMYIVIESDVGLPSVVVPPSLSQFCGLVGAEIELDAYL